LVRASQRTGAGPSKDILNSDDSVASARPYGEAVQSNNDYRHRRPTYESGLPGRGRGDRH
jgi:hypothetical protein